MADEPKPLTNPIGYPKLGSFRELLTWHLEWGSRPNCSRENRNRPWVRSIFATLVHGESASSETAKKNLRNWANDGKCPSKHEQDRVDRIYDELFGDDKNLKDWKQDLENALERGRGEHALTSSKLGLAEKVRILRALSHFKGAPEPPTSSQPVVPTPANPITVPHNDTRFIPPQIPVEIVRLDTKILWSAGDDLSWRSVAFSPMGDRIVATGEYKEGAWLWDALTGDSIANLGKAFGTDSATVFSPDGTHVVIRPDFYKLALLDIDNSITKANYRGRTARFSPDGSQLVCSVHDTAQICDTATGLPMAVLRGHKDTVYSAAFSPNGRFIVTASADRTAIVWNTATDFIVHTLKGHKESVKTAAFSSDSLKIVTASSDNSARIWSTSTGKELVMLEGHTSSVKNAAFSPDGRLVVTASYDRYARFWDAATGRCVGAIRDSKPVYDVAFSPCGNKVVTASPTGLRCFSLLIEVE
jgi:WD domain, G-beta repeat